MKLIHCADIHLDSALNSNFSKEKAGERNAEILSTFLSMISFARDNGIKAILIAGDLFDKKHVTKKVSEMVMAAITEASAVDFYYLKGNHDALDFTESFNTLPSNLFLFENSWTSYNLSDKVTVTGAEFDDVNAPILSDALSLDKEKINIVMLHGTASESALRSEGETIAVKSYKNKGIDYMALGHIHAQYSGVIDERGDYAYSGCLEGRGFDELGEHGFIILDINEEEGRISREFHRFSKRILYNPRVDVTGATNTLEAEEKVREVLDSLSIGPQDMIKISLTGMVDADVDISPELITKRFEGAYNYVKTKDETKTRIDFSAYANDASLKGEFIRTVHADSSLSDTDAAEIVRCGLRVLSGEEVFES